MDKKLKLKKEISLRHEILENWSLVKSLMITSTQIDILMIANDVGLSSKRYAVLMGCSIQSASNQLTSLYRDDWLERIQKPDPTGGYYYVYKTIKY